jgi:GTP-binding protein Era
MQDATEADGGGTDFRSGFVTVVGRPNVGKSTLVNRILGTKVTITSANPNTTRRQVRGVLHRPGAQAVFVDTPGLHKPKTALGKRLNEHIDEALVEVDVVLAVLDATARLGPGDRRVLERAARSCESSGGGLLVAVNKVDLARPAQVLEQLSEAQAFLDTLRAGAGEAEHGRADEGMSTQKDPEYFPVSAASGEGVDELVQAVLSRLPEGPAYFPTDMLSDIPEAVWVAELVREQLLARVRDELPHSIACRVTEWEWPVVRVEILVERESQKGIVIGHRGEVLKAVGTAVREQLPPGAFVELHVSVERRWQQRTETIERLGY